MPKIPVSVISVNVAPGGNVSRVPASGRLIAEYKIIPLRLKTQKNETIVIDKVVNIQKTASMKAGGIGDRYTCYATCGGTQKELHLYRDDNEWFLEDLFDPS